jgi:hypothetical protein
MEEQRDEDEPARVPEPSLLRRAQVIAADPLRAIGRHPALRRALSARRGTYDPDHVTSSEWAQKYGPWIDPISLPVTAAKWALKKLSEPSKRRPNVTKGAMTGGSKAKQESLTRSNLRQMVMEEMAQLREGDAYQPGSAVRGVDDGDAIDTDLQELRRWSELAGVLQEEEEPSRWEKMKRDQAAGFDDAAARGIFDQGLKYPSPLQGLSTIPRAALSQARHLAGDDRGETVRDVMGDIEPSSVDLIPDFMSRAAGFDWKPGKQLGPPKRPGETPVPWADAEPEVGETPVPWADEEEVLAQRSHPGSSGVSDDRDWSQETLYASPNIQGVPGDMEVVPAPDGSWAVIKK